MERAWTRPQNKVDPFVRTIRTKCRHDFFEVDACNQFLSSHDVIHVSVRNQQSYRVVW
jgi:hypothetical protein